MQNSLDPGLDSASFWSPSLSVFLVGHSSSSILLFVPMERVSHPTPSLRSGWLLTNVQVNNITTLHDTQGYTYIHHIGITILLPFYTSSTLFGRLAGPDPSLWHNYHGGFVRLLLDPWSMSSKCTLYSHSVWCENPHNMLVENIVNILNLFAEIQVALYIFISLGGLKAVLHFSGLQAIYQLAVPPPSL